jgi:hypothetical protein
MRHVARMALFLRFARYSDVGTVATRAVKRGCAVVMLAWVSWTNVTANDGSETWRISAATETLMQCQTGAEGAVSDIVSGTMSDRDQARGIQRLRDTGHVFRRSGPTSLTVTSPDGTTEKISFVCLPDTVDSRGPKGK